MKPTNHLFLLVKSFTPAEKRYFKLFAKRHVASGKSVYEKLFDALDNWPKDEYDEKSFLQAHRAKAFVKYYADEKRNLQELIMKAMRTFYAEDTIDHQISELLADEDFFRKKRLNELRAKALEKAKKLAYQYEKLQSLLTILEREVSMKIEWKQDELIKQHLEIGAEELQVIARIKNTNRLKYIYDKLFIQIRINTKLGADSTMAESKEAINDAVLANHVVGSSFVDDGYYYRTHSLYHRMHGNVELHKHYAQLHFELYEIHYPHQKDNNQVAYRVALFNYLNACFVASDMAVFPQLLKRAKEMKTSNADEEGEVWQNIVHLELIYLLNTAQLDNAMQKAPEIKNGLVKYQNKVNIARQLAITYNLAAAFFVSGKWGEALTLYNAITFDGSNARTDLKENAELLILVVHFELNNSILLESLIINARRRYRAIGKELYNDFLSTLAKKLKEKGRYTKDGISAFDALPKGHTELNLWIEAVNNQTSLLSVYKRAHSLESGAAKQ